MNAIISLENFVEDAFKSTSLKATWKCSNETVTSPIGFNRHSISHNATEMRLLINRFSNDRRCDSYVDGVSWANRLF